MMPRLTGLFRGRRLAALEAEIAALKAQQVQAPAFMREGIGAWTELPGLALPDAQAELYQRLSWVYSAVTLSSQAAAGTKFNVMKLQGEKTENIDNHPFEELLRTPNPLQSRSEFLEAVFAFRLLTGNAYIWLNRASPTAAPSELWLIPPQQIEPVPDARLYVRGYSYDPGDGRRIPLETWEISHLKKFHPRNPLVGLSPIEALAVTVTGDLAMGRWNTNFFDKNHAKPAGALAFADRLNDSDWDKMQRDIVKQHGGAERKMMLLRGTGQGAVSWVQFGVNQKDMEFLSARNFNKEEIYAALAPGLSSMLSVNATEANSKTGKSTFAEYTLWPMHVALAEKITRDILPAYGEDLIGEFEDVRTTDRAVELQEQQIAFKVLTVQEVREKYYNLGPLGDERDNKLVEGVSGGGEVPPQLAAFQGQTPLPVPTAPAREEPAEPPADPEEPDEPDTRIRADLLRWQRKAYKRSKAGRPATCNFESDVIPDALGETIARALDKADSPDAVLAVFSQVKAWMVGGVLTPIAYVNLKAIQATRLDFENEFYDLLQAARASDVDRSTWSLRARTLLRKFGERAYRDGLNDGGVDTNDTDPLDEDDQTSVNELLANQGQYVTGLGAVIFDRKKAVSDSVTELKPAMWFNKSISPFYDAGRLSAGKNGMYEWVLGVTEEHCATCRAASGQRHRLKEWHKRGIIPRADVLECKGFNCDCDLVRTEEKARGQFSAIPLGG